MGKQGTIIKSTGSWYLVKDLQGKIHECRIKGRFRIKGIDSTNPLAVGDRVDFELEEDETGVISEIEDRKNYIIRRSTNLSKRTHILAANLDQAFLFVTFAEPKTQWAFVDRFLVTAEAYHIPVVIVVNKMDLYGAKELGVLDEFEAVYSKIGYPIHRVSALNRENIEGLKGLMKEKVTLLSGHSGVGKSTLVNSIDPSLDLKTDSVSLSHSKGKHTTTFAEMFELDFGGQIIDTPGVKGFGLVDLEKEELSHYFPEMRELISACKFNNCVHINEPGCAVKEALEKGEISESRYRSYISLYEDQGEVYR